MDARRETAERIAPATSATDTSPRTQLLAGLPVTEHRHVLAGTATTVVEGGEGVPVVLLHGPGESAVKWMRVLPDLVGTNHVVAPDLPAHGTSDVPASVAPDALVAWLDDLVERTCPTPPVVVGHVLGGALAARYAATRRARLRALVLVDGLGLARFRPAPAFAFRMAAFQLRPREKSYERFMRQCSYDLDALRDDMGPRWDPFVRLNLETARGPRSKVVGRMLRASGLPRIPAAELDRISVPTTLVWGRHDRATRVRAAQAVARRHGWPLHVVEDSADDPPRDRPEEFLAVLRAAVPELAG